MIGLLSAESGTVLFRNYRAGGFAHEPLFDDLCGYQLEVLRVEPRSVDVVVLAGARGEFDIEPGRRLSIPRKRLTGEYFSLVPSKRGGEQCLNWGNR